uniref:SHSP domain-containing protein n=1 Tax=Oryza brachyantha TaxID=4533 RepID=J3NBN8_ORYBR
MAMDLDLAVQVSRQPVSGEDFAFATSDTDAAFLVLAHLPGYDKEEVEVVVGEGGREVGVVVGARKEDSFAVEAVVGRRLRVAHRQVVEGFCRVFDVPDGVEVGRISVGFEEDDDLLVVVMPKLRPAPAESGCGEGRLDVESADTECGSSNAEDFEVEPEQDDVAVETEVELDDESSSLELEYEDWIDVESSESEPEPPRDVAVEAPVPVEEDVPVEEEVAVETPVPVEEDVLELPPTVVDIECDVVFEPAYRGLPA